MLLIQSAPPRRRCCAALTGTVYQGLKKKPEKHFILLILGIIMVAERVLWFWYIGNTVKESLMGGDYESPGGRQLHGVRVMC